MGRLKLVFFWPCAVHREAVQPPTPYHLRSSSLLVTRTLNGGMEHTTLHLLYSRFWNKFLFDQGHVPTSEPYARRHSHGLVLASDGTKMSKSKGNVVNPDEIVSEYGADSLRMYILFMGPFEEPVPWSLNGVIGVRRFLDKVVRYVSDCETCRTRISGQRSNIYQKISKILKRSFNTAVAAFMSLWNEAGDRAMTRLQLKRVLLCPFVPCRERVLGEDRRTRIRGGTVVAVHDLYCSSVTQLNLPFR